MPHPSIVILGYSQAAMLLRQPKAASIIALLAIRGANEHCVQWTGPRRLELVFDDEEVPDPSDPVQVLRVHARRQFAIANGLVLTPPTIDHARAIIEFAETLRDVDGCVLCHCSAGVSRSPAAALLCLTTWMGPGRERECAKELLRIRPAAIPHRGLVRFGDQLLQRDGKLLNALPPI
jgi:predicted protein tyrosine phosphatase